MSLQLKFLGEKCISSQGFSLMEVMVALMIIGIVSTTFSSAVMQANSMLKLAEIKSEAQIAAQQVFDQIRLDDTTTMPTTESSDPAVNIVFGNKTYNVVVTYCSNLTYCPPTASNETRHLKVVVSYNSKEVYEVESVLTKLN